MERTVRGRPARFGVDLAACRRVIRSRCQRKIVSGRTSSLPEEARDALLKVLVDFVDVS
jgi:hypothetical protein